MTNNAQNATLDMQSY